ncbi:MAG: hypothetical protein ACRD9Q_02550 [Nitrososphaeraceae archaeon]
MKIPITLLISVVLLGTILFQNSSGQTTGANSNDNSTKLADAIGAVGVVGPRDHEVTEAQKIQSTTVFMQIKFYNSAGQLVGYTEGEPQIFNLDKVLSWLEPISHKSTIIKEGKSLELTQLNDSIGWSDAETMGAYFLNQPVNGKMANVLYFSHDSIYASAGDRAEVFWTVIKSSG